MQHEHFYWHSVVIEQPRSPSMHCSSRDLFYDWLTLFVVLCTSYLAKCAPTESPILFSYDDSTPFPRALKCFTCTDKYNNMECNSKAYDAFCPQGTKYCHTSHYMDHHTGKSLMVNKKCAMDGECTPDTVGCSTQSKGVKRCVSCCEGSKCNFHIPTNGSTAIFATITPYNGSSRLHAACSTLVFICSLLLVLVNSRTLRL